jgi:RNA polymerase sigma-70 factor (ECF subfamily)
VAALSLVPSTPAPVDEVPVQVPDGELVRRALDGDRWAEGALYRKHASRVGAMVVRLLQSRDEAEDVLHDAFVTAFEKLPRLREPDAFRGWLNQIAIMHVRKRLRRRKLTRALGLLPVKDTATLDQLSGSEASAEVRAELGLIDERLQQLPSHQRLAWMLRHVEGYQLDETAEACGCSLATVKRRLKAADEAMKARLSAPGDDR